MTTAALARLRRNAERLGAAADLAHRAAADAVHAILAARQSQFRFGFEFLWQGIHAGLANVGWIANDAIISPIHLLQAIALNQLNSVLKLMF